MSFSIPKFEIAGSKTCWKVTRGGRDLHVELRSLHDDLHFDVSDLAPIWVVGSTFKTPTGFLGSIRKTRYRQMCQTTFIKARFGLSRHLQLNPLLMFNPFRQENSKDYPWMKPR